MKTQHSDVEYVGKWDISKMHAWNEKRTVVERINPTVNKKDGNSPIQIQMKRRG